MKSAIYHHKISTSIFLCVWKFNLLSVKTKQKKGDGLNQLYSMNTVALHPHEQEISRPYNTHIKSISYCFSFSIPRCWNRKTQTQFHKLSHCWHDSSSHTHSVVIYLWNYIKAFNEMPCNDVLSSDVLKQGGRLT